MSVAANESPPGSSSHHLLPTEMDSVLASQQSPALEDVPAITAVPIPKPRTIKSPPILSLKPVPPKRKPLASSFVNVRNAPCDRNPVDVIVDVNNSLWRNVRIEDMDAAILVEKNSSIPTQSPSDEENAREREKSRYDNDVENDTINVHMEDITSEEPLLHKAYASPSYESDETGSNIDENMMIKGPEWVVPQEYSSSPIVKELAESCDQRPRPPSLSNYAGSLTMSSTALRLTPRQDKKVTLLEQIVRSHPIWYLQHIGRPTATHLLRQMEPGNFIVRASSKPGCMAVSVRLPDDHEMHTDHYIIEYGKRGSVVRLESSPFSFRSLPELIEHYCLHAEELQVPLRLPHAVLTCQTTKELQSVALMGQDFWTSEAALSRPLSRAPKMSTQSTSFMNLDECLPKIKPSMKAPPSYGCAAVDMIKTSQSKKRPSSTRGVDFSGFPSTCANTDVLAEASDLQSDTSNSPPMKHDRVEGNASPAISDHISRSERRTQSVRTKSVNPPPVTGAASTGRKSFLKSLFFGSGSGSSHNRRAPINQLAQCQYFVPLEKEGIRGSKSAFEIGSPIQKSRPSDWSKKHDNAMRTFKPSYEEVIMSARVCPLPMRRERSDLCASSVMRLAKHTERSPGPTCAMSTALRSTQEPPKRQPLRPPDTVRDPMTINNCIDELRRRRLQSTTEMLNPAGEPVRSPSCSPHVSMRHRNNFIANARDDWETNDVKNRTSRRDHRMSVPNLSPEPSNVVVQSAKALREKLGRNGDGELSTINEGLITPVIRRKQFNQPTALTCNVNCATTHMNNKSADSSSHFANGDGAKNAPVSLVSRGREALEALFVQQQKKSPDGNAGLGRRFNSERIRSGRESELAWRRANHCSPEKKPGAAPAQSSKRDSCFFANQPSSSWSAINSELKSKQRIAKVRPTLQARIAASKMTADVVNGGVSKNSEYAQLSDFSSIDVPKPDSKRDDDNVSVAGTVFNEPWDSNVWENLLDLASHGDEGLSPGARQLSDTIHEEDSDSDRTAGGSTKMHESEDELDEEMWMSMTASARRTLPSDRVTCKAWETDDAMSNYGTVDSTDHSVSGTLRKERRAQTPPHSMHSLPRAISRFSQQIGSLDDLPLSLPALSPNLNSERKASQTDSSTALQSYVERLAEDESTVFGATLKRFIECTVQSEEADPSVVVRNVRQFINGIKNYLVKHGEGDLHALIEQESAHLNANQILNIDAILEAVLHKLLLKRVKPHLYHVMVKENSRAGGLQALSANISYVRTLSLSDLGFSNDEQLVTPTASVMEQIKICLRKMQHHYSPLKKLENLLRAISIIMSLQPTSDDKRSSQRTMAADDLVRWLVYILARTSTVGCEVEAWYMWELLPQQMITKGDAAYYLTALFCAIHILKSLDAIKKLAEKDEDMMNSMLNSPASSASDAFVKVAIPDETAGCIRYATFPGVPQMTTGKLCRVIAHQQGITNPEDHGLYLIVNGFESCLLPHECPDAIRENLRGTGKPHLFAYKRHDAKIGWPRQVMTTPG